VLESATTKGFALAALIGACAGTPSTPSTQAPPSRSAAATPAIAPISSATEAAVVEARPVLRPAPPGALFLVIRGVGLVRYDGGALETVVAAKQPMTDLVRAPDGAAAHTHNIPKLIERWDKSGKDHRGG